jgi:hypothetical protein
MSQVAIVNGDMSRGGRRKTQGPILLKTDTVQQGGRPHASRRRRGPTRDSAQSETPRMSGHFARENRETSSMPSSHDGLGRAEKAVGRTSHHARRWPVGRSQVRRRDRPKTTVCSWMPGGRATDQGEHRAADCGAPDSSPERRLNRAPVCARSRTTRQAGTICGGRSVPHAATI